MTSRAYGQRPVGVFDPNVEVHLEDFVDILGRNFRQPPEGLGFDGSPVAHMWRTLMWPTRRGIPAGMKRSTDRILTTFVGSLIRPPEPRWTR